MLDIKKISDIDTRIMAEDFISGREAIYLKARYRFSSMKAFTTRLRHILGDKVAGELVMARRAAKKRYIDFRKRIGKDITREEFINLERCFAPLTSAQLLSACKERELIEEMRGIASDKSLSSEERDARMRFVSLRLEKLVSK